MELKEIAGYLPYDLKVRAESLNKSFTIVVAQPRSLETERTASEFLRYSKELKPLLRPMSDLTREILSEYYEDLIDSHLDEIIKDTLDCPLHQSYIFTDWLLSKHFDIHGLIDKDEAIDMSCL